MTTITPLKAEQNSLDQLITERWSPRAFQDKEIEIATLFEIFNMARWSPSSYNEQPWRFLIGKKMEGDTYRYLYKSLTDFNQSWASMAPVLILACAKKNFTQNGKPNPHYRYDLGQIAAHLSLKALDEGIYVHQMAGFDAEQCVEQFEIPKEYEPVTIIAMGYPGEAERLEEDLQEQEEEMSKRKSVESICFDEWNSMFFNP